MSRYAEIPWHTMPIDALEKKLKTNRRTGMTKKAARQRRERLGSNTLFSPTVKTLRSVFQAVAANTPTVLLLLLCLVGLCFSMWQSVTLPLCVLLLSLVLTISLYIKNLQVRRTMSLYAMPRITLIRAGKRYRAFADTLVPGDLICLEKGDVVPADARLLHVSDDFAVRTLLAFDRGVPTWDDTLVKDASYVYEENTDAAQVLQRVNTLFAGSQIVSGSAYVLVITTGVDTYHGALGGVGALSAPIGEFAYLGHMRRYVRRYSVLMWILLLPITVIAMLLSREHSLFDLFFLVLGLTVASMCDQLTVMGEIFGTCGVVRAALPKDRLRTAVLKNYTATDAIAKMQKLVVTDLRFFTDGVYHPYALCVQNHTEEVTELREMRYQALVTIAYYYQLCYGTRYLPAVRNSADLTQILLEGLPELFSAVHLDTDSLQVRMLQHAMAVDAGTDAVLTLNQGGGAHEELRIRCGTDSALMLQCQYVVDRDSCLPLDAERRAFWMQEEQRLHQMGCRMLWYATEMDGAWVLQGMIAQRVNLHPELAQQLRDLQEHHLSLTVCLDEIAPSDMNLLRENGIVAQKDEPIHAFAYSEDQLYQQFIADACAVIVGVNAPLLTRLIQRAQDDGLVIGAFGMDSAYDLPMQQANVCMTCDSTPFRSDGTLTAQKPVALANGRETVGQGAPTQLAMSDLVLRAGGGVGGVLQGVRSCRGIENNMALMLQYLLTTQCLRMTVALIPLLFGAISISPALILISGLWFDLAFVLLLAFRRGGMDELRSPGRNVRYFHSPSKARPDRVWASLLTGGVLLLMSLFFSAESGSQSMGGDRSLFLFCSLVSVQFATILLFYFSGSDRDRVSAIAHLPTVLYLLIVLLPPLLLICFPSLADSFGCAPLRLPIFLFALCGVLLYPLICFFCARLRKPIGRILRALQKAIREGLNS